RAVVGAEGAAVVEPCDHRHGDRGEQDEDAHVDAPVACVRAPSPARRDAAVKAQGRASALRAASTSARTWQSCSWSSTSPIACMKAYIVVGPTNFQPRFFRSFDSAIASGAVVMPRSTSRV